VDIGLAGAFVGGVLTLLSPCSVMLLPAFFAYAFTSPGKLLGRTGVFYLGLITTLVPMGLLAGTLGAFVNTHRMTFVTVAAALVIVLGLIQLLGIPLPAITRDASADGTSVLSVYLLGTVYGLAGVCAGPLLGAVLTLAAFGGNALYGGLVLAVFAAGMVVPLIVLAALWGSSARIKNWLRPREVHIGRWSNTWTQVIGGVLTIAIGVLLLVTDGTTELGGLLGASDQAQLESGVMAATSGVSDLVVAGGIAAVALVALVVARMMAKKRRTVRSL